MIWYGNVAYTRVLYLHARYAEIEWERRHINQKKKKLSARVYCFCWYFFLHYFFINIYFYALFVYMQYILLFVVVACIATGKMEKKPAV